jgi:hypothetical protein
MQWWDVRLLGADTNVSAGKMPFRTGRACEPHTSPMRASLLGGLPARGRSNTFPSCTRWMVSRGDVHDDGFGLRHITVDGAEGAGLCPLGPTSARPE